MSDKIKALALHLDCSVDDIEEDTWQRFSVGREEYMVLTDGEANTMWDEQLDDYLEECVLSELPDLARNYFDRDAWKRDARHDGRGHTLSTYDGDEHESMGYYIYRVN